VGNPFCIVLLISCCEISIIDVANGEEALDVIVAHISLNSAGGGELVCLSVVEALRNSGNRVTLATLDKTDWLRLKKIFGKIVIPDDEFYIFSHLPRIFNALNGVLQVVFFWFELLLIRLIKKSCLVVNTCGEKVNSIADIAYLNGVALRSVFLLEGVDVKRKSLSILYNYFSKIFDEVNPSLVIANSSFNGRLMTKCVENPVMVVYPPVRSQEFRNLGYGRKDENLVLTYSQYVPTQNLEWVLRIAEIVKRARFVVVGPNGGVSKRLLEELRNLRGKLSIGDRVVFLTNQSFSKYVELLSTAKVILRTLRNEPFGISVVEGMAAGCVPVVPRDGGPWFDILDQKQGEYGFSYESVREAAEIISRLVEDEGLWEEISARARERALVFDGSVFERAIVRVVEKAHMRRC
jgi:glycosyltransferase involved in cell wall biosynthesis